MHLLVLSAFRPYSSRPTGGLSGESVSMHLLVLSAFRLVEKNGSRGYRYVSMHLLVLSAFRHEGRHAHCLPVRLNAPFGAQCFPTSYIADVIDEVGNWLCLNAPFGAQCFPTCKAWVEVGPFYLVSMHLLVLSAFRHGEPDGTPAGRTVSMHLLVLSAFRPGGGVVGRGGLY